MDEEATTKRPSFGAFQVKEGPEGQSYFNRIGSAFAHKDGQGHTLQLDATPVDGRIVLRTAARTHCGDKIQGHAPRLSRRDGTVNAFDRLAATPPTISTKAELLQRLSERPKPTPERVCEPQDADSGELKRLMAQSNEDRIARLRASLNRSSATLLRDQAKSRLGGFARAHFEHER